MKTIQLITAILLISYCSKAQNTISKKSKVLERGHIYTGLSMRLAQPVNPAARFLFRNVQLKAGYFVLDNWSIDAAVRAVGIGGEGNRTKMFVDVELGFGYWMPLHKNLLFQLRSGVHLANSPFNNMTARHSPDIKVGAGFIFRLPGLPSLGLTLGADYFISTPTFQPRQIAPQITLGISFFFGRARNKKPIRITD